MMEDHYDGEDHNDDNHDNKCPHKDHLDRGDEEHQYIHICMAGKVTKDKSNLKSL